MLEISSSIDGGKSQQTVIIRADNTLGQDSIWKPVILCHATSSANMGVLGVLGVLGENTLYMA